MPAPSPFVPNGPVFGLDGTLLLGRDVYVRTPAAAAALCERLVEAGYTVDPVEHKLHGVFEQQFAHVDRDRAARVECGHCGALSPTGGSQSPLGFRCSACGRTLYWQWTPGTTIRLGLETGSGDSADVTFSVVDYDPVAKLLYLDPVISTAFMRHDPPALAVAQLARAAQALKYSFVLFGTALRSQRFDAEQDRLVDLPRSLTCLTLPYDPFNPTDGRGWHVQEVISGGGKGAYSHMRSVSLLGGTAQPAGLFHDAPEGWIDMLHVIRLFGAPAIDVSLWQLLLSCTGRLPHLRDFIERDGGYDPQRLTPKAVAEMGLMAEFLGESILALFATVRPRLLDRHAALAALELATAIDPKMAVTWAWQYHQAMRMTIAQATLRVQERLHALRIPLPPNTATLTGLRIENGGAYDKNGRAYYD